VIAAREWWKKSDSIEVAIVGALNWIGPSTAAGLARTLEGAVHPMLMVDRLGRLVSKGVVEVVDARRVRGVTVRRYRVATEGR
jgi:predicted ArsR family transcriptional regulator